MSTYITNQQSFSSLSPEALEFYRQHGFVVLESQWNAEELCRIEVSFQQMIAKLADEMNQTVPEYLGVINQWRDLWKTEEAFKDLLNDKRIHGTAQFFMEEKGVQLLHDHVISKPCITSNEDSHTNAQLPWHQDYPFWPVNTPYSLSCWMPFEDVGENGGCLEVVDGSHKWGISDPVDFIMDDPERFKDREDISLVRIPVRKGMAVILHSLTWHRSHPNYEADTTRVAYIALWIPAHAQYAPDSRKWHPLNDNITVNVGETLNTDHFPLFGQRCEDSQTRQRRVDRVNEPRTEQDSMDMFEADERIARQMHQLLQRDGHSGELLKLREYVGDSGLRLQLVQAAVNENLIDKRQQSELAQLLEVIHASTLAYTRHRARNVFNSGYAGWWHLVGEKLLSEGSRNYE